jgi:hypothetical protein
MGLALGCWLDVDAAGGLGRDIFRGRRKMEMGGE